MTIPRPRCHRHRRYRLASCLSCVAVVRAELAERGTTPGALVAVA